MRWKYGLAERGPAGLARAYVMRWLTLCRQTPSGLASLAPGAKGE